MLLHELNNVRLQLVLDSPDEFLELLDALDLRICKFLLRLAVTQKRYDCVAFFLRFAKRLSDLFQDGLANGWFFCPIDGVRQA
jgi:hypothetical protein